MNTKDQRKSTNLELENLVLRPDRASSELLPGLDEKMTRELPTSTEQHHGHALG